MANKSTAVDTVENIAETYPVLAAGGDNAALEAIRENLGGEAITPGDLDSVRVPAGGGTTWELPSLEGLEETKTLEGIIVAFTSPRAYWIVSPDDKEEVTPPDCSSNDGVFGDGIYGPESEGNPTGACDVCPMNQWGSVDPEDDAKRGKACREQRRLFLLRPGSVMPVVVTCPPSSIPPLKKYLVRLAQAGLPYYAVTTQFTLDRRSEGARQWSVINPVLGERLDVTTVAQVRSYAEPFRAELGLS